MELVTGTELQELIKGLLELKQKNTKLQQKAFENSLVKVKFRML